MSEYNVMSLQFLSRSENEAFARTAVAAFVAQLDPTIEELNDIKTVVSEAVTNAVIHGYEHQYDGIIRIHTELRGNTIVMSIEDDGIGIDDVELAKQPLYTSKPELERSGMGFTIMENFMDDVEVTSKVGVGTTITMMKKIQSAKALYN
jgi:stage II sporulation protein AB (anti-sigma F factor)